MCSKTETDLHSYFVSLHSHNIVKMSDLLNSTWMYSQAFSKAFNEIMILVDMPEFWNLPGLYYWQIMVEIIWALCYD